MSSSDEVQVLFDSDLSALVDMAHLVAVCAHAVDADADGRLVAPPRHSVDFGDGRLVFTAGGLDNTVGFRAYDTFRGSRQDQVVAVWDRAKGALDGVVIGDQLGALRTGAIGGVAVDRLANRDASTCAVIGTGRQARTQLLACNAVRPLSRVNVYSRSAASRGQFADDMSEVLKVEVHPVANARVAVSDAEIVLVATSSTEPVVDHRDMRPDAHINTVGPKFSYAHEIDVAAVEDAALVTSDSPQQIAAQGVDHFLYESVALQRVRHLGAVDHASRASGRSVFLSAGLAGTEVLVAAALLHATSTN